MTYTDIADMLTETEIPFTYYSFPEKEAPQLPYICYYYPGSDNEPASDRVYQRIDNLTIELYTETKDFSLEQEFEAVLDSYGIVWDKTEEYINTERMFMITYTTQVAIEGEE